MKIARLRSPILTAGAVALLMASSVQAASEWVEVKTLSFTVISDGSEKEARRVGGRFETFRAFLKNAWPGARLAPPRPVTILAMRSEEGLERLLPAYWETRMGAGVAGIFVRSPDRSWVALRTDVSRFRVDNDLWSNPYLVLFHEYVHLALDLNVKRMPVWLSEGLAEYWGNTVIEDDEIYIGHPIRHHVITLGQEPLFSLASLFAVTHASPEYSEINRASIFYAQSWALVHYLEHGSHSRTGQVGRFLQLLSSARSPEEAQREAFGDLKVLEKEYVSYVQTFQHDRFQYGRFSATITGDAQAFGSRTLSEAESLAIRATFHVATNRPAEARSLARDALALEPELAAAHEALGLLAWREGKIDEASQAFRRATELPDGSDFAHYLDGQFRWQQLRGPEGLEEVEASFRKAVELNPSFADAYALLARVMDARGAPLERTLPVATQAVKIAPHNTEHWITALRLMARGGYLKEARAKAEELLDQVEGQERAQVEQLIAELAGADQTSDGRPEARE